MSYILDSIKKSDAEREKSQSQTLQKLKAPAYLENANQNASIIIILTAILVLVSILVALYFFTLLNQGSATSIAVEKRNVDPRLSTEVIAAPGEASKVIETPAAQTSASAEAFINEPEVQPFVLSDTTTSESVTSLYERIPRPPSVLQAEAELQARLAEAEALTATLERPSEPTTELDFKPITESEIVVETEDTLANIELRQEYSTDILPLFSLDVLEQRRVPSIEYGAHIYASDNRSGFVILNGAKKKVGQRLKNGVFVEKINEGDVVLSYNGLLFSLPAMKSWRNP